MNGIRAFQAFAVAFTGIVGIACILIGFGVADHSIVAGAIIVAAGLFLARKAWVYGDTHFGGRP